MIVVITDFSTVMGTTYHDSRFISLYEMNREDQLKTCKKKIMIYAYR